MKTISIKKRLAAVAAVAVVAGGLSAVSATSANAAGTLTPWSSTNGAVATVNWASNDTTGSANATYNTAGSAGVVSSAFTSQITAADVAAAAALVPPVVKLVAPAAGIMLANGRLGLTITGAAAGQHDTLIVTGGQIISAAGRGAAYTLPTVNTDGTKLDIFSDSAATPARVQESVGLVIAPTVAAGGIITIQHFVNVLTANATSATQDFQATLTVAASSASGSVSTATSYGYLNAAAATTQASSANAYDDVTGFTLPNGYVGGITYAVRDAYKVPVTTGYVSISSDNCYVGFSNNYSTVKSDFAQTYSGFINIKQAVANTATSCATTISYNGTVIATKTIKFLGDVATITPVVGGVENVGGTGNGDAALLSVTYKDAAGNIVPGLSNPVIDSGLNAYVTGALQVGTYAVATVAQQFGNSVGTATDLANALAGKSGSYYWACTAGQAGSASVVLKTTNAAGATIKSAPVTLACGNTADSYTIATDKTTYATGDIATITVTLKDASGGVPNDVSAFTPANTIASGAFATYGLVTPTSAADTSVSGVLKYKAIIGQTAGTFPIVVSVPSVNAAHGKDQTAQITVTSSATDSVSQLVKVVGTLLTSFTKQIAALIKALSKKK